MATLYVTEFSEVHKNSAGTVNWANAPPIAQQTLAVGATSVQSAAFNAATRFVRLNSDTICSLQWGQNPTATAASMRMHLNTSEYFGVPAVGGFKVAVIVNT